MPIQELRTDKERTLYTVCLVVSCIFWAGLVVGTLGLGLFYVAAGAGFVLLTQALFLAAVKGNGVKITPEQFPDLHERIERAAKKLELAEVPEVYLLNHRGAFNAFATRFINRDFVVLYADLLEACGEDDGSIDFIIGHEVGHLALGHLKMAPVLLPSRFVPLLGQAYSRYCEYSCDRAGTVVAGRSEGAVRGLAVLAAGARYAKRLNVEAYLKQRLETGHFWMSVVELAMSHPYLPKRMGAILRDTRPEVHVPAVERNPFAYVAAPFLAGAAAGGGGGALVVVVMVVGMLAAIAIPSFTRYQQASAAAAIQSANAREAEVNRELEKAFEAARVQQQLDEPEEAVAPAEPPPRERVADRPAPKRRQPARNRNKNRNNRVDY